MVRISNSIQRELLSDNGINSTKLQYANVMRCYFVHVFINMRDFSFFFFTPDHFNQILGGNAVISKRNCLHGIA